MPETAFYSMLLGRLIGSEELDTYTHHLGLESAATMWSSKVIDDAQFAGRLAAAMLTSGVPEWIHRAGEALRWVAEAECGISLEQAMALARPAPIILSGVDAESAIQSLSAHKREAEAINKAKAYARKMLNERDAAMVCAAMDDLADALQVGGLVAASAIADSKPKLTEQSQADAEGRLPTCRERWEEAFDPFADDQQCVFCRKYTLHVEGTNLCTNPACYGSTRQDVEHLDEDFNADGSAKWGNAWGNIGAVPK